ncbi:30S ribosomal protein S13 [candidate division WWE3 bacterium CG08_land_8_20_14_0_20_40_13]|uniref:Small ribosomal subunit protein uS13 n=1 Tax=candidate division WWE3 bacterium CG08_land_8_20_14_0_20_40_13 TaxID=1975084 RepID=A0A2H0XEL6_UNCKA|nr:MAG: 30S ribosomal protein S13 [candidate division WWE3 bacterium CG08_land_8_20_14_0_20_40_13]
MARIAGIELPNTKRIEAALPYLYGVGFPRAKKILETARVNGNTRVKDLTDEEVARIRESLEKLKIMVEGELRRVVSQNVKRLIDIRCYRGLRHLKKLPVRGQRTKTNARTKRGKRQTIGGMKKVLTKT